MVVQATGTVSWRRPDIKYKKNEAFVDVIENVNLLATAQGNPICHSWERKCSSSRFDGGHCHESPFVWNA
jgi:hypothetical protein